jgi:hypothetical protein
MESASPDIWSILLPVIVGGLIALAAGVIAQMVTHLLTWSTEKRAAEKRAATLALRSAVALEGYAIGCWGIVYSSSAHYDQTGEAFADSLPVLTGIPDGDWRDLDASLADKVLSFTNAIRVSDTRAAHSRYLENNPFDVELEAKKCGIEAWSIAEGLRSKYKLEPRETLKW